MNITGSHRIEAPRAQVWDALHDPRVLVRTLPGCESLEATGEDAYDAVLSAGVASIKGTYRATVELSDKRPPESYRMRASGAGTPGTVTADVTVRLEDEGDATTVLYEAEAVVGGMIGGVGQRMLAGVAKRTAGEFFRAVERELNAEPATPGHEDTDVDAVTPADVVPDAPRASDREQVEVRLGDRFRARASRPADDERRTPELAGAALVGGLLTLAGVVIGRLLGRGGRDR